MRVGIVNNTNNLYSSKIQSTNHASYITKSNFKSIGDTVSFGVSNMVSPKTEKMFKQAIELVKEKDLKVKQLVEQTVAKFIEENPGVQAGDEFQTHGFVALTGKTKDGWNVSFQAPNGSFSPNWLLRATKGEPKNQVVRKLEYNNKNKIGLSYSEKRSHGSMYNISGEELVKWNKEARKYLEAILPEKKVVVSSQ